MYLERAVGTTSLWSRPVDPRSLIIGLNEVLLESLKQASTLRRIRAAAAAALEGSAFSEIVGGSPNTWRLSGYEATEIVLYHTLGRLPEPESTHRTR